MYKIASVELEFANELIGLRFKTDCRRRQVCFYFEVRNRKKCCLDRDGGLGIRRSARVLYDDAQRIRSATMNMLLQAYNT